jgi:hypothetical protein
MTRKIRAFPPKRSLDGAPNVLLLGSAIRYDELLFQVMIWRIWRRT